MARKLSFKRRKELALEYVEKYEKAGMSASVAYFHDDDCRCFEGLKCSCVPDVQVTVNDFKWE